MTLNYFTIIDKVTFCIVGTFLETKSPVLLQSLKGGGFLLYFVLFYSFVN